MLPYNIGIGVASQDCHLRFFADSLFTPKEVNLVSSFATGCTKCLCQINPRYTSFKGLIQEFPRQEDALTIGCYQASLRNGLIKSFIT